MAQPIIRHGKSSFDVNLIPDIILQNKQLIQSNVPLQVIHTPGHTPDHACFAAESLDILFSGDHVMGWSSTVIAPPLGHMGDYYVSLELLLSRSESTFLSGHGAEIVNPNEFVTSLLQHRKAREAQIIELLKTYNAQNIEQITEAIYGDVSPALLQAAMATTQAHVEWICYKK